ncbi:MAG TPA: hypothetical protein VJT31_01415 [Rugosimonospora sp.]|nr:hypothetical protein [Rugosimonospora sp.]
MRDGGYDEISGGPVGAGRRPRAFWLTVVLVAAAVVGLAWYQRRAQHPQPAPQPSAAAGRMIVDQVCPVGTDQHRGVAVSFRLTNGLGIPVLLVRAEPVLVLGGLRPVQTVMTSGNCQQPLDTHADGNLAPGGTVMIIFQFEVPAGTCPWPLPVRARLTVEAGGADRISEVPVLPDLGGMPFGTCPSTLRWRGQAGA